MLLIINYHYIRKAYRTKFPGIQGTNPALFEKQINYLATRGSFISQEDLIAHLQGEKLMPEKSILLTFDDGLKEQYNFAYTMLRERGIPAIFFVNSSLYTDREFLNVHKIHLLRSEYSPDDFMTKIVEWSSDTGKNLDLDKSANLGLKQYLYDDPKTAALKYTLNFVLDRENLRHFINELFIETFDGAEKMFSEFYMSRSEIKELAEIGMLGSHGYKHVPTAATCNTEQKKEVFESKNVLESITGCPIVSFSYPYGGRSSFEGMGPLLKEAGYQFAITTERKVNLDLANPFYLSRLDNNDAPFGKAHNQQLLKHFLDD